MSLGIHWDRQIEHHLQYHERVVCLELKIVIPAFHLCGTDDCGFDCHKVYH